MRINGKSIITLLIAFLMIFGTAFYSFTYADQPDNPGQGNGQGNGQDQINGNTQIHLMIDKYPQLSTSVVKVYIKIENQVDPTIVQMTINEGNTLFKSTDLQLTINDKILYFEIGGVIYNINSEIFPKSAEGSGTMNYEVSNMPKFTLTYHENGATNGSVPALAAQVEAGSSVVVLGNTGNLVKSDESNDYRFTVWNTATDASGTAYAPGSSFNMPFANVTLYAQWEPIPKHEVKYLDGGADPATNTVPTTKQYSEGKTVTVESQGANLKKEGWNFLGWSYNGKNYSAAETLTMGTSDIVFTAVWTQQNTYTVTYNGNGSNDGAAAPIDNAKYLAGAIVTLKDKGLLIKDHYTFKGWSTSSDGPVIESSTITMGTANITLYAIWEKTPHKVTYYGNGNNDGVAPSDSKTYTFGDNVTVMDKNTLAKTHYEFNGWSTTSDGLNKVTATLVMGDSDINLYAIWKPIQYKVTYDSNGGEGSVPEDNATYTVDSKATVLGKGNVSKADHDFKGWKIDNVETIYEQGNQIIITGNVTLKAVWSPKVPPSTNPPSTNPPEETNPPTTQPSTTEAPTVATTEAVLEEIEIEEEVGAPAGAASSIVEETEELVELDEPGTPLGDALPQTGQLPVELFYGVGGLITAVGVYLRRKSS